MGKSGIIPFAASVRITILVDAPRQATLAEQRENQTDTCLPDLRQGKKCVAMMQPSFLPWQGFFALATADVFVILDDFQVSPQSYHQRNRLLLAPGSPGWVTLPLVHSLGENFQQTRVHDQARWRKKTLASLQQTYGKHPFASEILPFVQNWIGSSANQPLGEFNLAFITMVCNGLGLYPMIVRSSEIPSPRRRSERVLDLLEKVATDCYLSAFGSFTYMREDKIFPVSSFETRFLDFTPLPYRQQGNHGEFIARLSILDGILNLGFAEMRSLVDQGTNWINWEERAIRECNNDNPASGT